MSELISVIVPIYNVEKYIYRCVHSIINQSYKNLEIILVDDGSPDNCPIICDEFAKKDSRIKVIHKKNGGLSDARNCGIDTSNGKYLVFIDSDDYIDNKMIEKLYMALIKYSCDIAVCNYFLVNDNNSRIKIRTRLKDTINISNNTNKYNYLYNEYKMLSVVAWNKIYKRSLFDNIRYPKGKINEDEFIICDLLYNAKKVAYISEGLYYYVQRKDSIIHTFNMGRFSILDSIKNREKFFEKIGDNNNYMETKLLEYILTLNLMIDFYNSNMYDIRFEYDKIRRIYILRNEINGYNFKNIKIKDKIRILFPKLYVLIKTRKFKTLYRFK